LRQLRKKLVVLYLLNLVASSHDQRGNSVPFRVSVNFVQVAHRTNSQISLP